MMRGWGAKPGSQQELCLKQTCFHAVKKHIAALNTGALLDLPAVLLEDLVPHMTVWQLAELQPALNHRGISTLSGWAKVLRDISGPHQSLVVYTEEEAKHEAMRMIFTSKFYGFKDDVTRSLPHLNIVAKCIRHFVLMPKYHKPLQSLAARQRPLLRLLEEGVQSIGVSQSVDMSQRTSQVALYVLHRLLDHGRADAVAVYVQCPTLLAWLLYGRGSQYLMPDLHSRASSPASPHSSSTEEQDVIPWKRLKKESELTVDPHALCQSFGACDAPSTKDCPWGQIRSLKVSECGSDALRLLNAALPTFFCLHSLTLHSFATFRDTDVLDFATALKQLSDSSQSVLSHLSIGVLPHTSLLETLLDASPKVTSLHVEIQTVTCGPLTPHPSQSPESKVPELPLEKLTVKLSEIQTDMHVVTCVLRRSPHLASLHVSGMRLPSGSSVGQLLSTVSEANLCLTSLILEDMKLCDCLPAIRTLLNNCKLEELQFSDCRLLEKWPKQDHSLKLLVAALKMVPSLRTLGLAQNRLARNVHVLAELFSGASPSSVRHLDISSNFIKPADLLTFAHRLRTHRPPHPLTLDLRMNPGDRDPHTWNAALAKLRPFCLLLAEEWRSTDSMVDHVSNM